MALILVIDDKKSMRDMLTELLEDAGHRVKTAANGVEGLQANRKEAADLVICDVFMPEKDGMSTIRDLRREFPGLPIIAISGGDKDLVPPEAYLQLTKRFGADEALSKPFQLEVLMDAVGRLLKPR